MNNWKEFKIINGIAEMTIQPVFSLLMESMQLELVDLEEVLGKYLQDFNCLQCEKLKFHILLTCVCQLLLTPVNNRLWEVLVINTYD